MNKIGNIYPLSSYDNAGRLKPPGIIYLCSLYANKSLVIFILATVARGTDTDAMLSVFYPDPIFLLIGLIAGLPAIMTFVGISYRDKLLGKCKTLTLLSPLFVQLSLAIHIAIPVLGLITTNNQFSPFIIVAVIIPLTLMYNLFTSQQMKDFQEEWSGLECEPEKNS